MPRIAHKQQVVRITITTTKTVHEYLQRLIPLGLYGSSTAEVAERLLCEALKGALKHKQMDLLSPKEQKE